LLVRGMCCLRAGIPNVSDNIHVLSVVGRFLEHSRMFYFHNDGQEQIYLGSADLMPRNINHRVEVLFPVQDIRLVHHLRNEVFETYFKANVKVREMTGDGQYRFITPKPDEKLINPQEWLINLYQKT